MKRNRPIAEPTLIPKRLPDAINCRPDSNFTQISNKAVDNPLLSLKAKGLLWLLCRNKSGWTSYRQQIKQKTKEGRDAIDSTLNELEKHGHLARIQYVDSTTKSIKGSFWAYTDIPHQFNTEGVLLEMDHLGLEPWKGNKVSIENHNPGKPHKENPDTAFPDTANPPLIILKDNKTNLEQSVRDLGSSPENGKYDPLARFLLKVITSHKNYKVTPSKIQSTSKSIRLLSERDGIDISRIKKALKFYQNHIGEKYIPVILAGEAFRRKFLNLEAAMDRAGEDSTSSPPTESNLYPELTDQIKEYFPAISTNGDMPKIIAGLGALDKLLSTIMKKIEEEAEVENERAARMGSYEPDSVVNYEVPSLGGVLEHYLEWLQGRDPEYIGPGVFNPDSPMFRKQFLSRLEDAVGFPIGEYM